MGLVGLGSLSGDLVTFPTRKACQGLEHFPDKEGLPGASSVCVNLPGKGNLPGSCYSSGSLPGEEDLPGPWEPSWQGGIVGALRLEPLYSTPLAMREGRGLGGSSTAFLLVFPIHCHQGRRRCPCTNLWHKGPQSLVHRQEPRGLGHARTWGVAGLGPK